MLSTEIATGKVHGKPRSGVGVTGIIGIVVDPGRRLRSFCNHTLPEAQYLTGGHEDT